MSNDYRREELHPTPRGLWITTFLSLMLSFALGSAWSSLSWPALPYGARGTGTVVSVAKINFPVRPLYLASVEYAVDGRSYSVSARLPSFSPLAAGDAMSVDYDRVHPGRGVVDYEADAMVTYATVVLVFIGGLLTFGFIKRRPRILEEKVALGVDRAL